MRVRIYYCCVLVSDLYFFFSSRRRHTGYWRDWSSDVCSSDLQVVGEAGDGARAVELAETLRPDLVILDVKMPVLDGIAAAERSEERRVGKECRSRRSPYH